jgi:hypothetical protein
MYYKIPYNYQIKNELNRIMILNMYICKKLYEIILIYNRVVMFDMFVYIFCNNKII